MLQHLLQRLSEPSLAITFLNALLAQCPDGHLQEGHLLPLLLKIGSDEDLRQVLKTGKPQDEGDAVGSRERDQIFDSIRSLLQSLQKSLVGREYRFRKSREGV